VVPPDVEPETTLDGTDVEEVTDDGTEPELPPDLPDVVITPEKAWDPLALDTNEAIRDVWGPGDGTFYAVGDHGTMLWYNGAAWAPLPHLTDANLYGVSGEADGDVYVVGAGGTVLRRDQAGWNIINPTFETKVDLYGVYVVSNSDVYIVGDEGVILRFTGTNFATENSNTTSSLRTVFVPKDGQPVAGGANGQLYRRVGGQWVSTQATGGGVTINDVWAASSSFQVAVGTNGTILVSTGTTWAPQTSNDVKLRDLYAVWGTGEDNVYCVGADGILIHYNGNKWTGVIVDGPLYTTRTLGGVWGTTVGERVVAFAGGDQGAFLMLDQGNEDSTTDKNWADTPSGPDLSITDITGTGSDQFMAVGHDGLALRWRPGRGWYGLDSNTTSDLHTIAHNDDGTSWAGGADGTIVRVDEDTVTAVPNGISQDILGASSGGSSVFMVGEQGLAIRVDADSIQEESTGTLLSLHDVWVTDDGSGFAVGSGGTIVARADDGLWSSLTSSTTYALHAVTGLGDQAWAAGDHGVLLHWDGQGWSKETASVNLSGKYLYGLWANDTLGVLAVGWLGTVLRRVDGTWIPEDSSTSNVLEGIVGTDDGASVWIVGRKGTVLRRKP
jgi:photosystem II stability/assembly factor-like uncharacterized protein